MFWEKKVKRNKMPNININIKRAIRIRHKLKKVNTGRYRLSIHRSSKNISAQIIDDKNSKTLISASSLKEEKSNKKKADLSLLVAQELAKKAKEAKIEKVYFDRGRYRYHGRVKAFADALRKGGIIF